MGNGRDKRFVSIGKKIVWAITFFMFFIYYSIFPIYLLFHAEKRHGAI